ncbi:uncharacterized protein LOC135839318 isoform X2 [Planococcus citri]|uniref:uncharacterized protein LOC135839318 isoform X2 n=1 Tax=Planococcus citri TaxID=170843 RepID=UPI0031F854F6
MQTEDDFGTPTMMLNSPSNIIKKLPNDDLDCTDTSLILKAKKEPRDSDRSSFVPAKKEPREDDQSIVDNSLKSAKVNDSTNEDKGDDSMNDITETSSDEENTENSNETKGSVSNDNNSLMKKEEINEVKMLDDQDDLLNDDDDLTYSNGSNEQYSFNLDNDNNDQLSNDYLDDEGADQSVNDCDEDGADADEGTDPNEELDADNSGQVEDDEEETALRETDDNNDCDTNLHNDDESATEQNASADKENSSDEQADGADKNATSVTEATESSVAKPTAAAASESAEKEPESETHDNKRPASRESTTSTTSNSSERLTIRSANDLNRLVVSVADAFIKKEQCEEQTKEKPHGGLSVVNPSQLGVSNSGGGNLLQNVNFAQPNDQMNVINYIGSSAVAVQCDVCEASFPDNIVLADHKANAGHYKCVLNPDCAALVFASMTELSGHQQNAHGVMPQSPVQQLAHQVQSLPYQMDQPLNSNYAPMQQYPPQRGQPAARPMVPQVYPGQQNNMPQIRGYSIANQQPRLQIGSVRGNVPSMAQPPNLKRPAVPPPPQPRITPTKRSRPDFIRNGDTDCKVVSVQKPDNTDDVVAQLSKSITITARQDTRKKNDTTAVTNMLANRGITVSSVPAKQNQNNSAVQMLNLNSAVSLIPTNNANNRQGRANGRPMAPMNASRLQTVDLTGPDPPRGLQMMSQTRKTPRFQCQICDRMFANPEQLNQHMITHGNLNRNKPMSYKCNQCNAQYPNQQQLQHHKQTFHRESIASTNEMVIPVVNLKQPGTMNKLSAIGVHHIIPLNALGSQSANGTFGIPILPLSSDRNQQINMSSCGITNILPIGPLKTLGGR